mgnify:CR=1 FL=1
MQEAIRGMRKVKIITAEQAAQLVKDNDTITSIGFVSSAHPEALTKALEKRFLETNKPQNLTYIYAGSQGIRDAALPNTWLIRAF